MVKNKRWLEPNLLSDEDKALVARIAKERHMTVDDVIKQLSVEQEKQNQPPPARRSLLKSRGQPEESRPLDPEPPGVELGYEPRDTMRIEETPPEKPAPDPRLVDIARLWGFLNERDREEMLLIARMKVHLNKGG